MLVSAGKGPEFAPLKPTSTTLLLCRTSDVKNHSYTPEDPFRRRQLRPQLRIEDKRRPTLYSQINRAYIGAVVIAFHLKGGLKI